MTDTLGSTRMVLNGSGVATEMIDYQPFGEEIPRGIGGRGSLYPAGFPGAVLGRRSEGTPRPSLVFVSTAIGAVTGGLASKMPAVKVPGITSGSGNMKSVAQGVATKIENGTASSMSLKTAVKGAIGGQVANAGRTATQTYGMAVTTTVCNANTNGACK